MDRFFLKLPRAAATVAFAASDHFWVGIEGDLGAYLPFASIRVI